MVSCVLPGRPDSARLGAFSVAVGLAAALAAFGVAAWWLGPGPGAAAGLGAGALVTGSGLLHRPAAAGLYAGWNRVARAYTRRAAPLLAAICLYAVFAPAAVAGSRLPLRPGKGSRSAWWAHASGGRAEPTAMADGAGDSLVDVVRWAARRKGAWVAFVVPFLFLIRTLDSRQDVGGHSDIYTLF